MAKTNIVIYGKAFSGVNTFADMIVKYGFRFGKIDMNKPINDIYNDIRTLDNHNSAVIRAIMRDVFVKKYCEYFHKYIGVPAYISGKIIRDWTYLYDSGASEIELKYSIYNNMMEVQPLWRKVMSRELLMSSYPMNYVITHATTAGELTVAGDTATIYVDADDICCYQHSFVSNNFAMFNHDYMGTEIDLKIEALKRQAVFTVHNNGDIAELKQQAIDLLKLLELNKAGAK